MDAECAPRSSESSEEKCDSQLPVPSFTRDEIESTCRVLRAIGDQPQLYDSPLFDEVKRAVLPLFKIQQDAILKIEHAKNMKREKQQQREKERIADRLFLEKTHLREERIKKVHL